MKKSKEEQLYDHALKQLKINATAKTVIERTVTKYPDGSIEKVVEKERYIPAHYPALKLILESSNPQEWVTGAKALEGTEIKKDSMEMIEGYLVNDE